MNNIDYKVGIYIRLSREDEEKEKYQESESIGNQRTLLMQYIRQNKLNFISEYVDDNYMLIDLGNQIVVPFDKYNTAKDIMDSAEEVDKAELLEFINKSFKSILEITKNKINDKINKNHDN